MYFRPGVRWGPTYRLDLADNGEGDRAKPGNLNYARLDLQGEIINEAEDFVDIPVDLVVGVPNFRFKNIPSPLALEKVMRNALAQAAPNLMRGGNFGNMMSNALFTQQSGQIEEGGEQVNTTAGGAQLPSELTTASGNDLFVYQLPKMSMKKGERVSTPILTAQVPYRNLHTWEFMYNTTTQQLREQLL